MELIKETVNICETTAKGTVQAMAEGEVIVPDIKPDILKLLQVDAEACITDKYLENGRLIICGRVDYKVLYVPDKENEKIKSILTSMDFRQAADSGGAGADCEIMTDVSVERAEFSAVNSRKLRLRAMVHIDYELCCVNGTELCVGTDAEDDGVECKKRRLRFENTVDISSHEFTVKESVEVPSGQSSVAELLKTDVSIYDTEYKTVTGKIIIKGIAGVCILYTNDDGDIKYIEAELPFTEVLDAEGVGEETVCDIDYAVIGVMCEVQPDSDGDMRVAELDIDIAASVRCTETGETELLCDCFVPYMKTECETESMVVNETVERPCTQNTMREIIDFPPGVPEVSGVYNVMANAVMTRTELQRGKLVCEGRVEAYILYLTESGENPVYSIKKDIPFSYMIECESGAEDAEAEVRAAVKHVSYNLNSGGELELRCLLSIEGRLQRRSEIKNIVSVKIFEKDTKNGIVIYFAGDGEQLWEVAKRYGIPCSRIAQYNKLDGDKIESGRKLFIPSR